MCEPVTALFKRWIHTAVGAEGKPRTHYTPFLCRVNPPMGDNCRAVFIEIHGTALQCAFYLHVVSLGRKLQTFLVCTVIPEMNAVFY